MSNKIINKTEISSVPVVLEGSWNNMDKEKLEDFVGNFYDCYAIEFQDREWGKRIVMTVNEFFKSDWDDAEDYGLELHMLGVGRKDSFGENLIDIEWIANNFHKEVV